MDKNILNNLKTGEQLVEMQECSLFDRTVIEVTVYTKKRFLGIPHIKKYTYPFYFNSKELAENFLKYSSYFNICISKPWNANSSETNYFYLKLKNHKHDKMYVMIDDYQEHSNGVIFQLGHGGIWNGNISTENHQYLDYRRNKNFMEIFNFANIGLKNNKTYIFKMIENG